FGSPAYPKAWARHWSARRKRMLGLGAGRPEPSAAAPRRMAEAKPSLLELCINTIRPGERIDSMIVGGRATKLADECHGRHPALCAPPFHHRHEARSGNFYRRAQCHLHHP